MFGKLLAIVVVLGVVALTLLVERQRRYETTLEISRTHTRILQQERVLARLRADAARRIQPAQVRMALKALPGDWVPLPHRMDQSTPPTSPRLAADRADPSRPQAPAPTEFGG